MRADETNSSHGPILATLYAVNALHNVTKVFLYIFENNLVVH